MKMLYAAYMNFANTMKRRNLDSYAAGASFFLFLSLAPMLILVCSIIPYTNLTESDLIQFITDFLPDIFDAMATKAISAVYDSSSSVLTISAVGTIWSASKGIYSLVKGINSCNEVHEKRNYFHVRFLCIFYTLIFLISILLCLVLMVFGNTINDYLLTLNPKLTFIHNVIIRPRYLYLTVILTFFFAAIYTFLPNKKLRYRRQIPGAILSAIGWVGFSFIFSVYVENFNSFSIYGSLAMVVVAMLWIYFCVMILLFGAFVNHYFFSR